jgi:photosystem II stability/assembly factor-like uncharacterized protein
MEVAVTVDTPPRGPETEPDVDLETRVDALEALIEEARRRARRRRGIYAAIVLTALGAAVWASFGIGGSGGLSVGRSASDGPAAVTAAEAHAARWRALGGPEGGYVLSLAIDPANTKVVYAGGAVNLFKSSDGGESWRVVSHEPGEVAALAIDPTHPGTVYTATAAGIGKSVDGGRHWRLVNAGLFNRCERAGAHCTTPERFARWGRERWVAGLLVEPSRPQTVYALVQGGLFRTTNGGGRWRFLRPSLGRYWFLSGAGSSLAAAALDPAHPGTVYASWTTYAGGSTRSRLYRSSDGGDSWQRVVARGASPTFSSLVVDPGTPETIVATDEAHTGIYRSTDGGTTWSAVSLPLKAAEGLYLYPGSQGTLYATATGGAVLASTDGGATWQTAASNGGPGSLVVDPHDSQTVYGAGDGVARSLDGGHTWRSSKSGLVNTLIGSLALAPGSPATLYAGVDGGVFRSTDRGRTWNLASFGRRYAWVSTLAVAPDHPRTILAGTPSGLFESTDAGVHWSRIQTDARNDIATLAVDPKHAGTIYVSACRNPVGCAHGSLFETVDGGATWRRTLLGRYENGAGHWREGSAVESLAIDPRDPNTVFAGTHGGGLYRSTDAGHSWQRVATAHGGPTSHRGVPNSLSTIAIDPDNPNTIYAGSVNNGILKSTDGGTTWATMNTGVTSLDITTLAIDPHNSQTLFASTQGGVFRSSNGGTNWEPYNHGLPGGGVAAFAIDPAGRTLYAGTNGDGVDALPLGR